MNIYIIGVGGVGSWLAPAVQKLIGKGRNHLWLLDGDKLEAGNLDRQLFNAADIGKYKAEALGLKYGIKFINTYYGFGSLEMSPVDWILCCADNHAARLACLKTADMFKCSVIIGANETHSAEAYLYLHFWKDSPMDPRVMYPEILTDISGDPMARAAGCTGVAQEQNRQLSSANFMAAALMQHLLVLWQTEVLKLDPAIVDSLPHQLSSTLSRVGCRLINETIKLKGQDERIETAGTNVPDIADAASGASDHVAATAD